MLHQWNHHPWAANKCKHKDTALSVHCHFLHKMNQEEYLQIVWAPTQARSQHNTSSKITHCLWWESFEYQTEKFLFHLIMKFSHTPHFGLGHNSVTIKRVGHGWVRATNLWNKHVTMPLMRLVVFDGQIISTVTVSPPSFSSAHPVPQVSFSAFHAFYNLFLWFQWLSCCCYFISFHSLPHSVGSLHSHASQFLRNHFILLLPPHSVFTHYKHNTGLQIPIPNIYSTFHFSHFLEIKHWSKILPSFRAIRWNPRKEFEDKAVLHLSFISHTKKCCWSLTLQAVPWWHFITKNVL